VAEVCMENPKQSTHGGGGEEEPGQRQALESRWLCKARRSSLPWRKAQADPPVDFAQPSVLLASGHSPAAIACRALLSWAAQFDRYLACSSGSPITMPVLAREFCHVPLVGCIPLHNPQGFLRCMWSLAQGPVSLAQLVCQ
jgi:hypothetical protein